MKHILFLAVLSLSIIMLGCVSPSDIAHQLPMPNLNTSEIYNNLPLVGNSSLVVTPTPVPVDPLLTPDEYCRQYISIYYFNGTANPDSMSLLSDDVKYSVKGSLLNTWDLNTYSYSFTTTDGTSHTSKTKVMVAHGTGYGNADKKIVYLEIDGNIKISEI
jgi:hypothetical protein